MLKRFIRYLHEIISEAMWLYGEQRDVKPCALGSETSQNSRESAQGLAASAATAFRGPKL